MLQFIEAILALVGFLAIVGICAAFVSIRFKDQLDRIDGEGNPNREGLDAAARISAMAFEAERLMHQSAEDSRRTPREFDD